MTRKLITSSVAALLASACVPALAQASPVQLNSLTLSPSCVAPGGSVNASVTVQDTTYYPQSFYGQGSVSEFGQTLETTGVVGSYTVPPYVPLSESETESVPYYTPFGSYTVNFGIGPSSSSPTSWSTRSATLIVSPFCGISFP